MRSEVYPGDLPDEDGRSSVVRDVDTFDDIYAAGHKIWNDCGKRLHSVGWAEIGKSFCTCAVLL